MVPPPEPRLSLPAASAAHQLLRLVKVMACAGIFVLMAPTLDTAPPPRRRSDAQRSIDAIVSAARTVLGERLDASMEDIAAAAGVTRQTVYAHFPSRDALIAALLHAAGAETVAAIDAARLDTVPPPDALRQFLDIGWQLIRRNPYLLGPALTRNPHPATPPPTTPAPPGSSKSSGGASAPATSTAHSPQPGWPPPSSDSSAPPPRKSPPDASLPARRRPCSWTARCDSAAPPAFRCQAAAALAVEVRPLSWT